MPPVRSLVGCALRRASTQAQQNKILSSGTRGTFRSGKSCATECGRLEPGTGLQLPLLNSNLNSDLQRDTVSIDTALTIHWQLHVVPSLKCPQGYSPVFVAAVCPPPQTSLESKIRSPERMQAAWLQSPLSERNISAPREDSG